MQRNFNSKVLIKFVMTALSTHSKLHLTLKQRFVELELVLLLKAFSSLTNLLHLSLWRAKICVCKLVASGWGVCIFSPTTAMLVSYHRVDRHSLVVSLRSP